MDEKRSDNDENKAVADSSLPDFERDVARCNKMITELEQAIESGDSFSATGRKEFNEAWKLYRKAKPDSLTRQKAEERLNRLADGGHNVEEQRAQLRRWIEQRRRLVDTSLKAEASKKKCNGGGGGGMFPLGWME